jgi:hypothetical protein
MKLLSIFHFIKAGMDFLGIVIVVGHYTMFRYFLANPKMWENQKQGSLPPDFFIISKWIYLIFAVLCVGFGVLNLISGLCIRARIYRRFSMIVAGINCFFMPWGTLLGVFTIIVLIRDSVQELYETNKTRAGFEINR